MNNVIGCKQRFLDVLSIVQDDKKSVELIGVVLSKIAAYCLAVYNSESHRITNAVVLEPEQLRESMEHLDTTRTIMHNSLIDAIRICNRHLFRTFGTDKIPPGGIYSHDPIHLTDDIYRSLIGNWAGEVFNAFFVERKR